MEREKKTRQVSMRLPPTLIDAASAAAARDHRSFAGLIEKLLVDYLKAENVK